VELNFMHSTLDPGCGRQDSLNPKKVDIVEAIGIPCISYPKSASAPPYDSLITVTIPVPALDVVTAASNVSTDKYCLLYIKK
jgi:hypothetical protein